MLPFPINFRKLRLNLLKMKLPIIKIGPKIQAFIEKISKGAGKEIAKIKELNIWESLISLAKNYGFEKTAEVCLYNLKDEELCEQIINKIIQVVDKMVAIGEK